MPQNAIEDLSNHLFEQLERLNDESLDSSELEKEVIRSKSMVSVSNQLIGVFKLELDATRLMIENGYGETRKLMPSQLLSTSKKAVEGK